MATAEGEGLSTLARRENISVNRKKRGMKESKLNHIGIVLYLDTIGIKV